MNLFTLFAVLITVTAILSFLNQRYLRLPQTIGVMAAALLLSLALIAAGELGAGVERWAESVFAQVDFGVVLMKGMLSFLLFAGSMHVDLEGLLQRRWTILLLATLGVLMTTGLVGVSFFWLAQALGYSLPLVYALVFGALIAPTDPIAVLGILKSAGAPRLLEAKIIGESLFNDGVGVVVFAILLEIATSGHGFSPGHAAILFAEEAFGGVALGLLLGYVAYWMLRQIDHHTAEILITLALVSGGYVLAGAIHVSGPIAMVVAGLFIGNHGRVYGMSDSSRRHLDTFWELTDEVLNSVLFVMIGLELLLVPFRWHHLALGLAAVVVTLAARFLSIGIPVSVLKKLKRDFGPHTVTLLTWGGIRGGISIALALAIPRGPERDLILSVTYIVVIFSILVQGLTVSRVVRWAIPASESDAAPDQASATTH